jgi:hypothetical protein
VDALPTRGRTSSADAAEHLALEFGTRVRLQLGEDARHVRNNGPEHSPDADSFRCHITVS